MIFTVFYMPRAQSLETIITKSQSLFGEKYEFHEIKTIGKYRYLYLSCKLHNEEFRQRIDAHTTGMEGCPVCKKINQSLTLEQFLSKARKKHGDRYNYDLVNYINYKTPVIIKCSIHGQFNQLPCIHVFI